MKGIQANASAGPKSGRNLPLEGLRGLLAAAVVLFHVYEMGGKVGWYAMPAPGGTLEQSGVYIVSIFFCVSGYLIVQSLLLKADVWLFLRNRIIRIYPVFLALHLTIFLFGPFLNYSWMGGLQHYPRLWLIRFSENLFFLPGVIDLPIAQKNAWSLSYEALFYLSAACLFLVLRRRNLSLSLFTGLALLGVILWRPLCVFFPLGYLAYAFQQRDWKERRWLGATTAPALVSGAFLFPLHPFAAILPVFLGFYSIVRGRGIVSKVLSRQPFLYLGRISFSLYLVHPFALDGIRRMILRADFHSSIALQLLFPVIGLPLSVFVSSLSYRTIEQGLTRRFLHRPDNDRIQRSPNVEAGIGVIPLDGTGD